MKKLSLFLIICILMLSLTACQAEKEVIEAIDSLGSIEALTLESEESIEQVQALYDALSDKEKEKVTNAEILEQAKEELQRQKALIDQANRSVDAIGEVTIESEEAILKARKDFDSAKGYDINQTLSAPEKVLISAEEEYAGLVEYIIELGQSTDILVKLTDTGDYAQIVEKAVEIIDSIPEGKLGDAEKEMRAELVNILVKANNLYAYELFEGGNRYDALVQIALYQEYEDYINEETWEYLNSTLDVFTAQLEASRPKTGQEIARTNKPGRNTLEFTAGDLDTCLKIILAEDPSQYLMVYVRANETIKVNLLNGDYIVRYTAGNYWFGEEDLFGAHATFVDIGVGMSMAGYTDSVAGYYYWDNYTWEPNTGYGDDYGYQDIDPEDF